MVKKETYVMSSMIKVDITVDERYCAKMRFYLLNAAELHNALEYCNVALKNSDDIAKFIPDFVDYVNGLCNIVAKSVDTNSILCPYEQIAGLCLNLGALEYPVNRVSEIGYIEEQFVRFDINNNMGRISPLTILYCMGIALTRKAMEWPLMWSPKYV